MGLYVTIEEPDEMRREILTASKSLISALKRYEHYHELRKAKFVAFQQLAKEQIELSKLARRLKAVLPKTDFRGIPPQRSIPAPASQRPAPGRGAVHAVRTKVQLLEDELSKVERKLSSLK